MEIPSSLRPSKLLQLSSSGLSAHFLTLIREGINVHTINPQLLHLIEIEALPPTFYGIWLSIAVNQNARGILSTAITFGASAGVRQAAISELGRVLRGPQWKESGWDTLKGPTGIISLIDRLPVFEVRLLCKAIARCRHASEEVTKSIEEVLQSALDQKDQSKRPLLPNMVPLLSLCKDQRLFVHIILRLQDMATLKERHIILARLTRTHSSLLRQIVVGSIEVPQKLHKEILLLCSNLLVSSREPYAPVSSDIDAAEMHPGVTFSLDLLGKLEHSNFLNAEENEKLQSSMRYALIFAANRKTPFSHILRLLHRCVAVFSFSWSDLYLTMAMEVVRCWSIARFGDTGPNPKFIMRRLEHRQNISRPTEAHAEELEELLVKILRQPTANPCVKRGEQEPFELLWLDDMLAEIHPSGRMILVKLLCSHIEDINIDLDAPPSQRERTISPKWDPKVLRLLPAKDAKPLCERSMAIRELSHNTDSTNWGAIMEYALQVASLEALEEESSFSSSRAVIGNLQRRTERCKDGYERCDWAQRVFKAALATYSLDVVKEVIFWSQRFVHDQSTIPGLLLDVLDTPTSILLALEKMPLSREPKTIPALQRIVEKANGVIQDSLGLLQAALREPWDLEYATTKVVPFIRRIFKCRMDTVQRFRKAGLGSEPELASILLESMVSIVLKYEHIALLSENSKSKWCDEEGFLKQLPCPSYPSSSVVMLLDQLAQKRDQAWQDERKKRNPSVQHLGPGWPKGLPVQYLLPSEKWMKAVLDLPRGTTYVGDRAYSVLFAEDSILSVQKRDKEVAGTFTDSLAFVIRSFVDGVSRGEQRKRIRSVLVFYSQALNTKDSEKTFFCSWLASVAEGLQAFSAIKDIKPPPGPNSSFLKSLDTDNNETLDWNPSNGVISHDAEALKDSADDSLLQCRMQAHDGPKIEDLSLNPDPQWVWALKKGSPNQAHIHMPSIQTCEAVALSALLFLDILTPSRSIMLSKYPGKATARFPPIRLDESFLVSVQEDLNTSVKAATAALEETISTVPPTLLRDLAVSLLNALSTFDESDSVYSILLTCTPKLVKLLGHTDKPELAIDVALRVLQDYPQLSTYHRYIGLTSLARRVSPDGTNVLFTKFTNSVCERLGDQVQRSGESPSPHLKITTAKLLPELLCKADFLSPNDCLGCLESLFQATAQTDICCVGINAWLELIVRVESDDNIYQRFARFVTAIVMTRGPSDTQRIILEKLIGSTRPRLPKKYHQEYVEATLLPILEELSERNTLWMRDFLSRVNLTPEELSLPTNLPFYPDLLDRVLANWAEYLRVSILERHRSATFAYLLGKSMSQATAALVKADPDVLQKPEGEQWTGFIQKLKRVDPFFRLDDVLSQQIKDPRPESYALTPSVLTEEYFTRAKIVIRNPVDWDFDDTHLLASTDVLPENLEYLRKTLYDARGENGNSTVAREIEKLMERIFNEVESRRSENATSANPIILPSFLRMRCLELPWAKYDLQGFARSLLDLTKLVADNPHHMVDWRYVRGELVDSVPWEDWADCAVLLAHDISPDDHSFETLLRVQLAYRLLNDMEEKQLLAHEGVMAMLRLWSCSRNEYVRRTGWELRCEVP